MWPKPSKRQLSLALLPLVRIVSLSVDDGQLSLTHS